MSSNIRIHKVCLNCGEPFIAKTTSTRFCSSKCASQNYKLRAKNKKIETILDETVDRTNYQLDIIRNKDYLSINEAAVLFNISRSTIYRFLRRNEIPFAKFGKRTILRKADLDSRFDMNNALGKWPDKKTVTEFYSKEEVMEKYNVKNTWLYKIIKTNNIPKVFINNKLHLSRSHIDRFFADKQNDLSHITEWYTVKDICEKYKLEPQQIYWRLNEHNITRKKTGRITLIAKDDFDQHMQNTNRRN